MLVSLTTENSGGARLVLGIETSNPSASAGDGHAASGIGPGVALARVEGGTVQVLGVEAIDPQRPHDAGLMPVIDRLTRRVGVRPRDLRGVAVSIGPGGYTGVRVAVTTAKFIAECTGAACFGVPTALVIAARVEAEGAFAVALGSKDGTAFVTRFDAAARAIDAGRLLSVEGVGELPGLLIADRFLPAAMREAASARGIEIRPPIFDPVACVEASLGLEAVDPALLVPLYPREPEAVTKWRELKGGSGAREK